MTPTMRLLMMTTALGGGGSSGTGFVDMYSINRVSVIRVPEDQIQMFSVNRVTVMRLP